MAKSKKSEDGELRVRKHLSEAITAEGLAIPGFGSNTLAFWNPKAGLHQNEPDLFCQRRLRSQAQKRELFHTIHVVATSQVTVASILHAREIGNGADFLWIFLVSDSLLNTETEQQDQDPKPVNSVNSDDNSSAQSDTPIIMPTIISTIRSVGLGLLYVSDLDDVRQWKLLLKPRERWPVAAERDRLLERCARLLTNT